MPSKNSINKPKDNLIRQRKSHLASKKRVSRGRQQFTSIKASTGITELIPITHAGGVIANTIMSKKKAKKLERNSKYIEMRNKSNKKKNSEDVEMSVEDEKINKSKQGEVRSALWELVENVRANGIQLLSPTGEGTSIGKPEF